MSNAMGRWLRVEFVAVDTLGNALPDAEIGHVDCVLALPQMHERVRLGGELWRVVDIEHDLDPGMGVPQIATLKVRRV